LKYLFRRTQFCAEKQELMNSSGKQHYFLQEMHLLDSLNNKEQTTRRDSAESLTATTAPIGLDDFGECDYSLASYKSDFESSPAALSPEEANELLYESLKEYPPFTNQIMEHMIGGSCSPRESYTFTAGHDLMIKVQIRNDVQGILFSTVVHKLDYQQDLSPRRRSSKAGRNGSQGSYYALLTKMMKCNALLGRTTGGGRVVSAGEGSFVFFQDVDMGVLYDAKRGKLQIMLEDFLLKAMEIRRDFDRSTNARKHPNFGWLR
jgi:hypothetical protein